MSGTINNDDDDGWAELLNELGLENNEPAPVPRYDAELQNETDSFEAGFDEDSPELGMSQDLPIQASDEGDETQDDEDDGDEGDDESQPKKKRRRRRRRKKKGSDEATSDTDSGDDTDEENDPPVQEVTHAAESYEEDHDHHSADLARELIAHWDVPPWEQIVAGLYRPNH